MSGLEGIGAASAIFSLIAVARKLRATFENIPQNQVMYHDITKTIVETVELFDQLIRERQGQVDASELYASLSHFTSRLETIYTKATKVFAQRDGVAKVKAHLTLFFKADEIREGLLRVEKDLGKCIQLFLASTAIRTEINTREMQERLKSIQSSVEDLALSSAPPKVLKTSEQRQSRPHSLYGANHGDQRKRIHSSIRIRIPSSAPPTRSGTKLIGVNEDDASYDGDHELVQAGTPQCSRSSFGNFGRLETWKEASIDSQAALARSISDRAGRLGEAGRMAESLRWSEGALEIRRDLAKVHPAQFKSDLAIALHNHCICLGRSGYVRGALECVLEAVEIRQELARGPRAASKAELASSLHILSICLCNVGQAAEGLAPIEKAVEVYRELVRGGNVAFGLSLASGLGHLSNCLDQAHRYDEAVLPIQEAVEIRRGLVRNHRSLASADFARSLTDLASRLRKVGRIIESIQMNQEAVGIYRELINLQPLCRSDYARSLSNLGVGLKKGGRGEESLPCFQDAVSVSRELLRDGMTQERPLLALHIWSLSFSLKDAGRVKEAIGGLEEVVELFRGLWDENSLQYQGYLDGALKDLYELRLLVLSCVSPWSLLVTGNLGQICLEYQASDSPTYGLYNSSSEAVRPLTASRYKTSGRAAPGSVEGPRQAGPF